MAIEFTDIESDFHELRGFVLTDLEIVTSAPKGGNYTAVLLVMTACEALGVLRYGTKDGGVDYFENYLLPKQWRVVSKSLYGALRNGLAHSFSTKLIVEATVNPIEIGISWSKEKHLNFDSKRSILFINVHRLSSDLRDAFTRYESELRQDAELRDRYSAWRKKQRVFHVKGGMEKVCWDELLKQTKT